MEQHRVAKGVLHFLDLTHHLAQHFSTSLSTLAVINGYSCYSFLL
jgi:hypothetical protein